MAESWVALASLVRPRGNRGEVIASCLTSGVERFQGLAKVFLRRPGESAGREAEIERAWLHDGELVLKFRGVDGIGQAEALRGMEVCVPFAERRALDKGEYFQDDLPGCVVVETGGEPLGAVRRFLEQAGGPGLLELDTGLLIPFARSICRTIDLEARRITVELPEGLKELNG